MGKINLSDIIEYAMVDLHLHFDGAISVNIIEELLKLQPNKKLPNWNALTDKGKKQLLSVTQECENLNEYLKKFDYPEKLLQSPETVKLAIKMLVQNLEKQGYIYADIRFAPQLFSTELRSTLGRNMTKQEEDRLFHHETQIVKAALDGIEEAKLENMEANIILCCMRNKNWSSFGELDNQNANERTIKIARLIEHYCDEYKPSNTPRIIKLDIAGGEAGNKNEDYIDLYKMYKKCNFKNVGLTIHSGEAGTLQERLENLSMVINKTNANIGHGVAIGEIYRSDISKKAKEQILDLMYKLVNSNRVLEVCLTSNYQTKAVRGVHPIVKMIMGDRVQGIPELANNITINTDNPVVSNTTLKKELELFVKICIDMGLSEIEVVLKLLQLKKNSIMQSGLSEKKKKKYLYEISKKLEQVQEKYIR